MRKFASLVTIFACMAVFGIANATDGEFSLSFGVTKFGRHPENHWFQNRYPHKLDMTSSSLAIGYRYGNLRLSYEYLGSSKTWALADPDDANYNVNLNDPNPCLKKCLMPANELPVWRGHGDIHGISLLYIFERGRWGMEVGALVYRPTWTQHVERWYAAEDPDNRYDITVKHKSRIGVAPAVNFTYALTKNSSAVLSVRGPLNQGGQFPPEFHGLSLGVFFRQSF